MMEISEVKFFPKLEKPRLKVAAYARISYASTRLIHSLSNQMDYYENLIKTNPEWNFAGIFYDSGLTGTTTFRPGFNSLIENCKQGKIDLILTKSISRFARNTVDLLNTIRMLKAMNIEVRFEKEGINSLSEDGELLITLLASFAQEESKSISDNIKWRIRKDYEKGVVKKLPVYGYIWNGDKVELHPEQSEVVRRVFEMYLSGKSIKDIATILATEGKCGNRGSLFSPSSVAHILKQERYVGRVILQKTFIESHLTHKIVKNTGQLPKYVVTNFCPAIVTEEEFNTVQEIQRQRKRGIKE